VPQSITVLVLIERACYSEPKLKQTKAADYQGASKILHTWMIYEPYGRSVNERDAGVSGVRFRIQDLVSRV
jgi:hypothetical protein